MPYVSQAQERWAHTPSGQKALGGAAKVSEWDAASKGMKLQERAPTSKSIAPARKEAKMRKPFGSFAP